MSCSVYVDCSRDAVITLSILVFNLLFFFVREIEAVGQHKVLQNFIKHLPSRIQIVSISHKSCENDNDNCIVLFSDTALVLLLHRSSCAQTNHHYIGDTLDPILFVGDLGFHERFHTRPPLRC